MSIFLMADVGSTFTKLTAVDTQGRRIIGSARAFTTIETNVMDGFTEARQRLEEQTGSLEIEKLVVSSSAAGGLGMVAIGLVPELTVQAARLAAANAGAKILKTYGFELSQSEVDEIVAMSPDMILLSGGCDGGNKEVIVHNAQCLMNSGLFCAVVVAGNKCAADEVKRVLEKFPGRVIFCPNVMPEINQLSIEAAQAAIRDLFIENIIEAKGLKELQQLAAADIMPTPSTVLEAARLLSQGTREQAGVGELLLFDVGGATTDVYSMAEGAPTRANVFTRGMQQPWAKRSVEGDLGLRYSQASLVEAAGVDNLAARLKCPPEDIMAWLARCTENPGLVPSPGSPEKRIDDELARAAVSLALARHCGKLELVYTLMGQSFAQTGKDLSQVKLVVGTGGPIIDAADPDYVLGAAIYEPADLYLLKPIEPELRVDKKYILSAMGSLARVEADLALEIMKKELGLEG